MGPLWQMAARNALAGGRRSILLVCALAVAACCMVLVSGLLAGLAARFLEAGVGLRTGHVNAMGVYRPGPAPVTRMIPDAGGVEEVIRRSIPGVDYVTRRYLGGATVASDSATEPVFIYGVDIGTERRLASALAEGVPEAPAATVSRLANPNTVVLFESVADHLRVRVGDAVTLWSQTAAGATNSVDVVVVAVADDRGDLTQGIVYANVATVRRLFDMPPSSAGSMHLFLHDSGSADSALADLGDVLAANHLEVMEYNGAALRDTWKEANDPHWRGTAIALSTWRDQLRSSSWRLAAGDAIFAVLFVLLASLLGAGLTTAMFIAVQQRAVEIGTIRAIGASRGRVALLFVVEGTILGGVGSLIGVATGALLVALLNAATIPVASKAFQVVYLASNLVFSFRVDVGLTIVMGLVVVSGLAALPPALRAARLMPVEALRVGA